MRILKNQTKQGSSGSSQTGDAGKKTKQLSKQSSLESKESGSLQDGVSTVDGVLLLQPLEELPEVDDVCVYEMQEGFSDDIGNLLIAPYIQSQSAKQKKHNEDRIISGVHCVWENLAKEVKIPFSVFGICDGHGGKQASTIASERLVFHVQQYLKNLPISDVLSSDDENTDIEGLDTDIDQILQDLFSQEQASGCADEEESTKLSEVQIRKQWKIEDEMMRVLPSVLHTAFVNVDKECKEQCQQSGTTATLLVMVGWQVVVASVGDSYCYMDTGKSIKLISSNHRVEDNQQEREAVLARGGKIAKEAMDDGSPVGPLRVWPGGLQMSRSLGDKRSESVISPVPDIKLTTIPVHGARFVLASDGLWDAFKSNPKSALQQIRGSAAGASAPKLLVSAVKKNGLKDDVSILVVDATKEEKGVVGSGDSDFVETSVLDVPKDGGQDAQWKMQRQRIYQVRKQLLQILVQQQKSKAAWETVAKQVDESKEVKSGEQEEQGEQSSSMVNQDLYNLKIDVETLQEGLSKVEIGHNEDEDDEGGEWQTTKKAPKPPGRRSTRNVYTRGRYPPNPNRNTRNTRSVSVRGQYQQSPQQVRRSSSGTESVKRAPIPSKEEITPAQIRERVDNAVQAQDNPFSQYSTAGQSAPPKAQSEENQGPQNTARNEAMRGRRNTTIAGRVGNGNEVMEIRRSSQGSRGRGGNSGSAPMRGGTSGGRRPQNHDYVVRYQKRSEVVEFSRTSQDVVSFQKNDVVSVKLPPQVVEMPKASKSENSQNVVNSQINKDAKGGNNANNSATRGRGRDASRGNARSNRGRGGNRGGPSYTFEDVKTPEKVSAS